MKRRTQKPPCAQTHDKERAVAAQIQSKTQTPKHPKVKIQRCLSSRRKAGPLPETLSFPFLANSHPKLLRISAAFKKINKNKLKKIVRPLLETTRWILWFVATESVQVGIRSPRNTSKGSNHKMHPRCVILDGVGANGNEKIFDG